MLFAEPSLAQIRQQDLKNQVGPGRSPGKPSDGPNGPGRARDYDRAKALYSTQSLTRPEFDQAQARF